MDERLITKRHRALIKLFELYPETEVKAHKSDLRSLFKTNAGLEKLNELLGKDLSLSELIEETKK